MVARASGPTGMDIIGIGVVPSRGIKKGIIVDVIEAVAAIRESVDRAAAMAGITIESAFVGVTGDHIEASNCRGAISLGDFSSVITNGDLQRALQAATREVPRDREILHSLPRTFIVDGHRGVKRPLGMAAHRLEVETHVVTGSSSFLRTLESCVERAGVAVEALVLEPIASSESVTEPDERDLGVALIDIGGGTSDIAVFVDGNIAFSGLLSVGGNHVTRDLAIGLRTPFDLAERVKLEQGTALTSEIGPAERLDVMLAGSGERMSLARALVGEIIRARMGEIFEMARDAVANSGAVRHAPGGIVLTGGGSLMAGAVELAEEVFQMPVRLGRPLHLSEDNAYLAVPQYATCIGLCRFGRKKRALEAPRQTAWAPPGPAPFPTARRPETPERAWGHGPAETPISAAAPAAPEFPRSAPAPARTTYPEPAPGVAPPAPPPPAPPPAAPAPSAQRHAEPDIVPADAPALPDGYGKSHPRDIPASSHHGRQHWEKLPESGHASQPPLTRREDLVAPGPEPAWKKWLDRLRQWIGFEVS